MKPSKLRAALPLSAAGALLAWLQLGYAEIFLDHQSAGLIGSFYGNFLLSYAVVSCIAVALCTVGFGRLLERDSVDDRVVRFLEQNDRLWLAAVLSLAVLLPLLWRQYVYLNVPLTDDESVYRFTSELLLSGRLFAESPPLKIFFDQSFMVNDGRYYGQYFLGWPALLALFRGLGLAAISNGVLNAVGVLAVFLTMRLQLGSAWAKIASVLTLSSPLLFFNAATMLSHTSCFAALGWTAYCSLRLGRTEGASGPSRPLLWSALAALTFCVAFFIRPQSALPVGGPIVAYGLFSMARLPGGRRWASFAAFTAVSSVMGIAFLAANHAITGSAFLSPYQAVFAYARSNGYRFTHFSPDVHVPGLNFGSLNLAGLQSLVGWGRLNFAAFGWPSAILVAAFGLRSLESRIWLVDFGCSLALLALFRDVGVDIVGPVHYTEVMLPLIALTTIGLREISRLEERFLHRPSLVRNGPSALALAFFVSLLVVSWCGYWPMRGKSQRRVARAEAAVLGLPEKLGIEHAIIFVNSRLVPECLTTPAISMVFWWPVNDPDMKESILYANHLTLKDDRRLAAEYFPDRGAYLLARTQGCQVGLMPLFADLDPAEVREGLPGGLAAQPDAEAQGWLPERSQ